MFNRIKKENYGSRRATVFVVTTTHTLHGLPTTAFVGTNRVTILLPKSTRSTNGIANAVTFGLMVTLGLTGTTEKRSLICRCQNQNTISVRRSRRQIK